MLTVRGRDTVTGQTKDVDVLEGAVLPSIIGPISIIGATSIAGDLVVTTGQKIEGAAELTLSAASGDLTLDTVNDGHTITIGEVCGTIEIGTDATDDKEIFIGTNASATSEISVRIGDPLALPSSEVHLRGGSTGDIQFQVRGGLITVNDATDIDLIPDSGPGFVSTSIVGCLNERARGSSKINPTFTSPRTSSGSPAGAGERILYNPGGGTFTLSAPTTPAIGWRWAVKNFSADLAAITISGNGSDIEDPTGSFALAATFSLSGNGIAAEWEYTGTEWVVI